MNIEILERKENPLLDREEITFELHYDGESTPARLAVQSKLAALLNADAERTIIRKIEGKFGRQVSTGHAYIYPSVEIRDKVEAAHIIKRNTAGGDDE